MRLILDHVGGNQEVPDARVVVQFVPTPGHTRGHQSLRVELESGPVVLTGDCVYMESMLDAMQVPTMASERAQAQHLESMRYLASLRDDHGCRLLFGHDQAQFQSIPADGIV